MTTRQQVNDPFPEAGQKEMPSVAQLLNALVRRLSLSLSLLVNDLVGGPLARA